MKIEVQDFVPEKAKGGLFKAGKIQQFEEVVDEMNAWLAENDSIKVISVETVVLPNIHEEEGSRDTELYTAGESHSQWYQLIRVWYSR